VIDLRARQLHRFGALHCKSQTLSSGSTSPAAWPDIRIDLGELFA